ncbi:MAG TPA: hypothetical protein VL985_03370 [Stellaceae bacterium]|nr:hypothetical protein [Stellaceae bacterium]HUC09449.1 hypothetical protein [Stellaceae bacterium]
MSALGHYLEEESIATVAVVLIRPQAENTKPPRALWVPFELGRPFGPPNDPAFQKRVVLTALGMLVEDGGPVRIIDFPDDDPRARPDSAWQPPFMPVALANGSAESLASRLEAEILLLQGAHRRWIEQHGRSTVGLTGLPIGDSARYVADWLRGKEPPSPRDGFSAPLILRFAVDDLKAFCLEAAAAGTAKPSSRQLTDWLWNATAIGVAIHALREMLQAHEDDRLRLIVSNFMVPAARVRNG